MVISASFAAVTAALLLGDLPLAFAHGDDGHSHGDMSMAMGAFKVSGVSNSMSNSTSTAAQSYFAYPSLSGFMVAHIVLMTLAWLFILPISEFQSRKQYLTLFGG